VLTKEILKEWKTYGLEHIAVLFKGTGMAREGVFKAINETGLVEIDYIHESTPIQFGWCKRIRPKRN
jgi:ribosomal protein S11